jgi:hypothetical protein
MSDAFSRKYLIDDWSLAADGVELLVAYAEARRMPMRQAMTSSSSQFDRAIDKFYWRASDAYLTRCSTSGMVKASELPHNAVHNLVVTRYGESLSGRPGITFLGEALASNLDLLIALQGKLMNQHKDGSWYALQLDSAEKLYGKDQGEARILALMSEGLADPFAIYRAAVLEMLEFYRLLLEGMRLRPASGSGELKDQARRFLSEARYAALYGHYDIGANVLYAIAYCGFESSPEDRAAVDECLAKLKSSTRLSGLLIALGIEELIAAGKPAVAA